MESFVEKQAQKGESYTSEGDFVVLSPTEFTLSAN